jgi:hypothetical protein
MNRISDLIAMLEYIKRKSGDLPVTTCRARDADGEEENELITEELVTVQNSFVMFIDEPDEVTEAKEFDVCHIGEY